MKEKLFRWFSNLKLQVKFFCILFLALVLVFVGTLVTSRLTDDAHNDALYQSTMQLLNLFSQNIQGELDRVVDSSFEILADHTVQDLLSRIHRAEGNPALSLALRQQLGDQLSQMELPQDVTAFQLRVSDRIALSRTAVTAKSIPEELFDQYEAAVHAAGGREIWVVGEDGQLYLLRDVREIAELSLATMATIIMRVDLQALVDRCCKALIDMDMPLQCAVDLNGTRLYATRPDMPGLEQSLENFTLLNLGGQMLFCVRYAPRGSSWVYTAAMPYDNITQSIRWAQGLAMGIVAAALVVALLLGSALMASIVRHIKRLLSKYDGFAKGEWKPNPADGTYRERRDEIGELHRQFDRMAAEHQTMIDDIYIKQQLLLEAQLKQLKAQIQPHFLYNTLETIYCLAQAEGVDPRIATMTGSLGKMLRGTLQDHSDIITVERDMQIAQDYMNIQLIRYSDRLNARFEIDPPFLSAAIPAMTLQPLVENAVRHAAEEMLDMCEIRVFGLDAGRYIDLVVEDNGPGMAEDTLFKLESGEMKPTGTGVGLTNIHKRLALISQDEGCGLRIRRVGGRTQVIVRILKEGRKPC